MAGGGGVGSFVGVVVPSAEDFDAGLAPRPIERLRGRLEGDGDTSADGFIDTTRDLLGVAKMDFDSGDRARDTLALLLLVLATLLDAAERSEPATLPAADFGGVPLFVLVAPTPETRRAANPGDLIEGEGFGIDPGCCCAAIVRCH